jgi:hypothetical protein
MFTLTWLQAQCKKNFDPVNPKEHKRKLLFRVFDKNLLGIFAEIEYAILLAH